MNKVILLGRLVRDPEVVYTPSNKVVCKFTLAVSRDYANQEGKREADFIPVVIWGKLGETAGNNLKKGQRTLINGKLHVYSFDGKDGQKRWVTEVIANQFEFIEKKITDEAKKADNIGKPFTYDEMPSQEKTADFEKAFGSQQNVTGPIDIDF